MRYDGSEKVVLNKISFLYVISPNKNSSIFSIKSDTLPIRIPLNLRVGLFALNLRAAYKIKFQVKKDGEVITEVPPFWLDTIQIKDNFETFLGGSSISLDITTPEIFLTKGVYQIELSLLTGSNQIEDTKTTYVIVSED
ncbi:MULTISPECIES: hypothetical protein [Lactobacillaceae]|uniref:hypothetical protein n=1 Tax=Lactobacillaceae TaxID=33958 RepID=UPI0011DD4D44|nr:MULTISPECIES: hypothetical protein [Lactobacillaceae]